MAPPTSGLSASGFSSSTALGTTELERSLGFCSMKPCLDADSMASFSFFVSRFIGLSSASPRGSKIANASAATSPAKESLPIHAPDMRNFSNFSLFSSESESRSLSCLNTMLLANRNAMAVAVMASPPTLRSACATSASATRPAAPSPPMIAAPATFFWLSVTVNSGNSKLETASNSTSNFSRFSAAFLAAAAVASSSFLSSAWVRMSAPDASARASAAACAFSSAASASSLASSATLAVASARIIFARLAVSIASKALVDSSSTSASAALYADSSSSMFLSLSAATAASAFFTCAAAVVVASSNMLLAVFITSTTASSAGVTATFATSSARSSSSTTDSATALMLDLR
mmetsp:Transcript_10869/g.50184  ORF Transcript_10869/g.50184 Transcript_10869/m.50184 type:complete len:349 (+) Transcript_10869:523-1569(+)